MQNYESVQPGGTGKHFGKREESRTAAQRIRSSFSNAADRFSEMFKAPPIDVREEWREHAEAAKKARSALVVFLEGAMGTAPEDENAYAY